MSPTSTSEIFGHVLEAQPVVSRAHDHPLRTRPLDQGACCRIPIDQQLNSRGTPRRDDDPTHDALWREHGHVGSKALRRALVDRHGPEVRTRRCADDLRGRRLQRDAVPELEDVLEAARAVGQCPLLLDFDLRAGEVATQRLVLGPDAAKPHVAGPHVPHTVEHRRGGALHLRERTEGDRFQDRHTGFRVHLRRDQHHMADHHREKQVAGTEPDIEKRHRQ